MMEYPRVFDLDGMERDWNYAKNKYGVAFRRAEVEPGQKVYRLVELREKRGPASLVTQVLDASGYPMADVDVALYWSGAPDPPDPPTPVYAHDWYRNFVHGVTNLNGDVGPGMGTGAYHGIGEGGPHAVWVRDPDILSDICEKLGMLAGTPHDHFDQKFQLVPAGGELPWFEEVERIEETEGVEAATIRLAWPRCACYDTASRGGIKNGVELETSDLVEWWHNGETYALSELCCDFEDDEPRTFWMEIHSIVPPYPALSDWVEETFTPSPDLRCVTYIYKVKGDEPGPGPEPEPEWTMTVVEEHKPGTRLLIGSLPEAGMGVLVTDQWGNSTAVISGSKPEHGPGGFEVVFWHPVTCTIEFLDQAFTVEVGGDVIVRATFEQTEEPSEPTARLVSSELPQQEAEDLLQELEDDGFGGIFALEIL